MTADFQRTDIVAFEGSDPQGAQRTQTECNLVVRLSWAIGAGHSHPEHTFLCAQDPAMAAQAAQRASDMSPAGLRLLGAATSATGGRDGQWEPLALDCPDGWNSGPCT